VAYSSEYLCVVHVGDVLGSNWTTRPSILIQFPLVFLIIVGKRQVGPVDLLFDMHACVRVCVCVGGGVRCIQACGGEPEGQRSFGRPRHRWEDNLKISSGNGVCVGIYWIDVAQVRGRWRAVVDAVIQTFDSH